MSAIPDPPVIESAENSPVQAESPAVESPLPPAISEPPVIDATPASAESSRGGIDGLDRLLMASRSISSPVLQTATGAPNPVPMFLEKKAAPKAEVVPEIPRRFCMMRVGERGTLLGVICVCPIKAYIADLTVTVSVYLIQWDQRSMPRRKRACFKGFSIRSCSSQRLASLVTTVLHAQPSMTAQTREAAATRVIQFRPLLLRWRI